MNLVIDDAVEVRQATKTEEEKRRPLGMHTSSQVTGCKVAALTATATAVLNCMLIFLILGQILLKGDNVSLIQAV